MPAPLSTSISQEPKDVSAELSLVAGSDYQLQYQGAGDLIVRKDDDDAAPTDRDGQLVHADSQTGFYITPEADIGIWMWSTSPAGGIVVVELL